MLSSLTKSSFYGKSKIRNGVSFNSAVVGDKINFTVYNNRGIIVYESFNNIDDLKSIILKESLTEREQFLKNLVCFLCDIKENNILNESTEEINNIFNNEEPDNSSKEETDIDATTNDDSSELDDIRAGSLTSTIGTFLRPNVPKIYAFTTSRVPNAIKIGFTLKSAQQRLDQWKDKYEDATLIHWWPATLLVNNVKSYFKDFPVHTETIQQGFDNLAQSEFSKDLYFSKEFFRNLSRNDQNKKLTKEIISEIVDIVKDKIKNGTGSSVYQSYKIDSDEKNDENAPKEETFVDTSLQTEAIQRGIAAYKAGKKSMLLAAVMRFGKTHVAYSIAKGVGAKFIVVASAKVDTKGEWRKGIYHSKFKNAVFIEYKDNYTVLVSDRLNNWYRHEVGLENFNINMYIEENRMTVVFVSLQDLSGKKEKETNESELLYYSPLQSLFEARIQKTKHDFIFNKENDLFIIDETHYGARAGIYGKPVKGEDDYSDKKDQESKEQAEQKEFEKKIVNKIHTKCQLHLSGTPYQIMTTDEFNKHDSEVIGRYSYTDMLTARDEWVDKNVKENDPNSPKEEDSPYFGIPDIIRFGLKLTKECRTALKTQMNASNSTNKLSYLFSCEPNDASKFHFESAIIELAEAIFGGDKMCGFLNDDTIVRGSIFNHIVAVMPSVKACHAFKKLLIDNNLLDKNREVIVAVENSSTAHKDKCTETVQTLNDELERLDKAEKKSLTLTWGRFLTGASVPLWDSMLYLKDTENAQEYDQATFRICTRHIGTARTKDSNGNEIVEKVNLKPNVYLIDFKIDRLFNIIADTAMNSSNSFNKRGLKPINNHIEKDLQKIPLYVEWGNGKKMSRLQSQDFMKYYTKYNENSSIEDLVYRGVNKIKGECLNNQIIRSLLTRFNSSSLQVEKQVEATTGNGDSSINLKQGDVDDTGTYYEKQNSSKVKPKKDEFEGKLVSFLKNMLYCIICLNGKFDSLEDLINHLKNNKDDEQIGEQFLGNNCILLLDNINKNLDVVSLNEIDAEIRNINTLLNDTSKSEIERVQIAIKKLGRLDKSEVVAPPELAKKMIGKLDDSYYQNANTILEVNSKTGEFLVELYNKYGKDVAEKVKIVASSNMTKQFIKRILALLDLPEYNLLDITAKDFIETKKLNNMKFDICLMNPPYSEKQQFLDMQFVNVINKISYKQVVVHPANRWISTTKLGKENIEGEHLKSLEIDSAYKIFGINPQWKYIGIYEYDNDATYQSYDVEFNNNTYTFDYNDYEKRLNFYKTLDVNIKNLSDIINNKKSLYDNLIAKYKTMVNDGHGFIYEEHDIGRGAKLYNIIKKDSIGPVSGKRRDLYRKWLNDGKFKYCLYKGSFNNPYDEVQEWKFNDKNHIDPNKFKGHVLWLTNSEKVKNNIKYWLECPLCDVWRKYYFNNSTRPTHADGCAYGKIPALDFEMSEKDFKKYVDSINSFSEDEIKILKDQKIHNANNL